MIMRKIISLIPPSYLKNFAQINNNSKFNRSIFNCSELIKTFSKCKQNKLIKSPFINHPLIFNKFSTSKKPLNKKLTNKQIFTLKKSQMIPDQKVFLLYSGQKQQNSFRFISTIFVLLIGLSLVKIYYTQTQFRRDQYIVLATIIGSFIIYQRRMINTLKRITLSQKGDKINITTFNYLAQGEINIQAPVEIMLGIYKATMLGGNIIKGGGRGDYKEMKFWFNKGYIVNKDAFQYVVYGKQPRIKDQFQTL